MKIKTTLQILLFILISGFTITTASAKGLPDKITIDGPDLKQTIEIEDKGLIASIGLDNFDISNNTASAPSEIHSIYVITRYYVDGKNYVPFDQLLYVPNFSNDRGSIYYVGITNGYGPYDGNWYKLTEEGESELLTTLLSHGVDFDLHTQSYGTSDAGDQGIPIQALWIGGAMLISLGIGIMSGMLFQTMRAKFRPA
jgi:hypothetical protein